MKQLLVFILLTSLGLLISCKETFLEQKPVGAFSEADLESGSGVKQLLVGAYSMLNGLNGMAAGPGQQLYGDIRGGESHKGSASGDQPQMLQVQRFEVNTGNSSNQVFFQFFYNAIFRANQVLKYVVLAKDLTEPEKKQITAEARFLRGHYHFMLKRLFGNVPYIDENAPDDLKTLNFNPKDDKYIDIWPAISQDFDFARKNLPSQQSDWGRPNNWAAEAYYGKVLLYRGNEGQSTYPEALTVFKEVIANGKNNQGLQYALLPNFHDNFNAAKENHAEWIFGVQHSINDGTTTSYPNANQDVQYLGSQNTSGPGSCPCFGFDNPSQWFVDHFRVNSDGLPILDEASRILNGIKSDEGISVTAPFTTDLGLIDPRLDWSVGRRGIPYLDYGMYTKSWVRDPGASSPYMTKKWFTYKAQTSFYASYFNAMNTPIIRFADVLLMTAELEARVGSLENARTLVNQVRNRMLQNSSSPDHWVKNADGSNAANYKIGLYPSSSAYFGTKDKALEIILFERLLELGQEGHRGYDLIRYGSADIVDGRSSTTDIREFSAYINFESKLKGYLSGSVYTRTPDMFMPIPQNAIDFSFKDGITTLKQNPGY